MKLPDFEYAAPATPAEAVALLAARAGAAKLIAGGQSLLPTMAFRLARPALLVDVRNLADLRRIDINAHGVVLGARARWCEILDDPRLPAAQPLLVAAIRHVAHYQIRHRGTVGGSVAHADPAAEMPCIAATCDAEIRVLGPAGERRIPAAQFFEAPLMTCLGEDELILDVRLPAWPARRKWAFAEFSRRQGDFALAGVALFYDVDDAGRASNAHVGVMGGCYRPKRLDAVEAALNGRTIDAKAAAAVAAQAGAEAELSGDIHASADYRAALLETLLAGALMEAAARR